jgi:hypothetical protein
MMPDFETYMGKDFMDAFPKPLGRNSTPDEQRTSWSTTWRLYQRGQATPTGFAG